MNDTFVGIFLLGAALWDRKSHRIPNWWILLGCMPGIVLSVWERGVISIASFVLAAVIVTAVFFPLFVFHMMGAGDIKVMAVVCGYLGLYKGSLLIMYGFLAGALFSAFILIKNGILIQRLSYFLAYFRQFFTVRKVTPYYLADRDGYGPTIHFAVCLWLGWGADLIQRRFYI